MIKHFSMDNIFLLVVLVVVQETWSFSTDRTSKDFVTAWTLLGNQHFIQIKLANVSFTTLGWVRSAIIELHLFWLMIENLKRNAFIAVLNNNRVPAPMVNGLYWKMVIQYANPFRKDVQLTETTSTELRTKRWPNGVWNYGKKDRLVYLITICNLEKDQS